MADGCEYLTGQTIAIDGARFNATGGNFYNLSKLSDGEWQAMSEMIRCRQREGPRQSYSLRRRDRPPAL